MFVVVTRTHFAPQQKEALVNLSKGAVDIASRQPGFIAMRVHLAHDATHTLTYWEWASEADHLNCTTSADWAPWTPEWEAFLAAGASFDIATYDVIASA